MFIINNGMEIDVKVEKENTSLKRQKVFLLNTHLYGLMNEAELHIQRLCIILDILKIKRCYFIMETTSFKFRNHLFSELSNRK